MGITPACAGKRDEYASGKPTARDHPRVCGEKCQYTPRTPEVLGSPPRVRGKVYYLPELCTAFGITPACAGKSAVFGGVFCRARDHPRVCGEKRTQAPWQTPRLGSPPRVRGKVHRQRPQVL